MSRRAARYARALRAASWLSTIIVGAAIAGDTGIPPQIREHAMALAESASQDPLAQTLLESLVEETGPRPAGGPGEARARAWAVARMTALGFENVRVEPFTMDRWDRGRESVEMTGPQGGLLDAVGLGRSVSTPADGITAPVALVADFDALLRLGEGELDGKIAFINGRTTRTQTGAGYAYSSRQRNSGPYEAARRGAVGVLIRSVGTDDGDAPHAGLLSYGDDAPRIPAAALSARSANRLEARLQAGQPVTVRMRLESAWTRGVESGNVIGEIPGNERSGEWVLLGAHIDSLDIGPGAADDAAGVAIVIAAAQQIARMSPDRGVRVVLFGAEESGLQGAVAYREAHDDEIESHVIAVEADFGAAPVWGFYTNVGASERARIGEIAEVLRGMGIVTGHNQASGGEDLGPLRRAGVPVVSLVQDGMDYFDIHHTANDTLEAIDMAALRQNVAAFAVFGYLAAMEPGQFRDRPDVRQRAAAVAAMKTAALPIASVDPGPQTADLEPLVEAFANARVIAAGEATHGTSEFFRFKHRLFRHLVERQEMRTFAIEANYVEALAVDRYIKTGEGDAEVLVHGLGFWTWDTEEVVALVEWMRAWTAETGEALNFYGFDIQNGRTALSEAVEFATACESVSAPESIATFRPLLDFDTLEGEAREAARAEINREDSVTRLQRAALDLDLWFKRHADALIAERGQRAYWIARGGALAASRSFTMALPDDALAAYGAASDKEVRDRAMADLVHWIGDLEGPDERIFLWAHNAHVGKTRHKARDRTMGMHLSDELGEDYYSLGFVFDEGAFQAFPPREEVPDAKLSVHRVPPAPEGNLGAVMADTGLERFFVDLARAAETSADAKTWLERPRPMRWTGALYSDTLEAKHPPIPILDTFDGLVFIRETSAARPARLTRERFEIMNR